MVRVLPFDKNLGYPQRQRVLINQVQYDLIYRWNHTGGFCVLTVLRSTDEHVIWRGKLVRLQGYEVRDPVTRALLWTLMPHQVDTTTAEVWVFYD
jgi:hypothetical protein